MNKGYKRTGSLFENPFERKRVGNDSYFITLVAYIHRNPQTHRLVDDFRDWPWSSYGAMLSQKPTKVMRTDVLEWFGGRAAFVGAHLMEVDERLIEPLIVDDFEPGTRFLELENLMARKRFLYEMTRPEVEAALASGVDTAVATFGSTEQHGLHLPMGTDSLWGEELGRRVTEALGNALQVPGLRIGCSEHHMDFVGSLTLSEETFIQVVSETCHSLARHGFKRIVLIPTHGGNFRPIGKAAELIQPQLPAVKLIAYSDLAAFVEAVYAVGEAAGIAAERVGAHAGEHETSMILGLRPDLVDMNRAEPGFVGDHLSLASTIFEQGFRAVTANGVLGDPRQATAELGERYLQVMTQLMVAFINEA